MMKRLFTILLLFSVIFLSAQEKQSYKIDLKIKSLEDSVLYLAYYYGDKTFLIDTALKKGKNNYVFEDNKHLDGGIYIVVGQNRNSIFEFLIADSQDIKFDSDIDNLLEKMKVKGSNENALFFDYLSYSSIQFNQLKVYQQKLENFPSGHDSIAIINKQIEYLNIDIVDYKEAIIEAYPEAFISSFFLAMKSPEANNLLNVSKHDSILSFLYYKNHYWDYLNFDEDRLIRTPVFHNKLEYYFNAIVHPSPDSLIKEIDYFLSRLPEKSELYKHSLWHLTLKFDQSNQMGYDAILVYFADNYYAMRKAPWLNDNVLKNILDEANKRRNSLIGKIGPNLVMQDLDLSPISMYSIDKDYTILYFWDPNCSHCKVETPNLHEFYKQYAKKFNLEVFAVCADSNLKEMKNYIIKHKLDWINVNGSRSYTQDFHELYNVYSTPFIFVLDKNKTIIAKQIKSDQLFDFISNYETIKQTQK
jgi:thiol-disulfide isomerase/thioredoxin